MAFDWKGLVRTVAPTLATALGGPLAGMATRAIGEAVLGRGDASEQDIEAALMGATPETLLALKKADQDFAVRMKELDIEVDRIDAGDRADARKRAIDMNDWTGNIIGALVLLIWGYINVTLLQAEHPPAIDSAIVGRILGMTDAATLAFLYYLFGSSRGSAQKNEIIGRGR